MNKKNRQVFFELKELAVEVFTKATKEAIEEAMKQTRIKAKKRRK